MSFNDFIILLVRITVAEKPITFQLFDTAGQVSRRRERERYAANCTVVNQHTDYQQCNKLSWLIMIEWSKREWGEGPLGTCRPMFCSIWFESTKYFLDGNGVVWAECQAVRGKGKNNLRRVTVGKYCNSLWEPGSFRAWQEISSFVRYPTIWAKALIGILIGTLIADDSLSRSLPTNHRHADYRWVIGTLIADESIILIIRVVRAGKWNFEKRWKISFFDQKLSFFHRF